MSIRPKYFKAKGVERIQKLPAGPPMPEALRLASEKGDVGMVRSLIAAAPELVSSRDQRRGGTPLHWAAHSGKTEVVRLLVQEDADVNALDASGSTSLHLAAAHGHLLVAQFLLAQGTCIDARRLDGQTPLYGASWNGSIDLVKMLLARGADANANGVHGWTSLHAATYRGHLAIVEILLAHEANPDPQAKDEIRPLYIASCNGDVEVAKLLLDRGADVNSSTQCGWKPLHVASYQSHLEMLRLLVENHADANSKNNRLETPLYLAVSTVGSNAVALAPPDSVSGSEDRGKGVIRQDFSVPSGDPEVIKLLLDAGANVNEANNDGWAPLHTASANADADVVKLLLANGADVNLRTLEGLTPLYCAANKGRADIVELLIGRGAEVNAKGKDGWTALAAAAKNGHAAVIGELLVHGADAGIKVQNKFTALNYGILSGCRDAARSLLAVQPCLGAVSWRTCPKCRSRNQDRILAPFFDDAGYKREPLQCRDCGAIWTPGKIEATSWLYLLVTTLYFGLLIFDFRRGKDDLDLFFRCALVTLWAAATIGRLLKSRKKRHIWIRG